MMHGVISLPTLDRPKATKNIPRVELSQKTGAKWDGHGMKLNRVSDVELKYAIHVIAHKIYSRN